MIVKTQAICLKSFAYKESSSMANLYTKDLGLKTYIIQQGRKKTAKVKSSFFQPLQIMNIVVYDNQKNTIQQIKECSLCNDLTSVYTNMVKMSLAFFIDEILHVSLKEDNPNEEMYNFICQTITTLNDCENTKQLKDFHLYFMYHLACYLGFEPLDNYSKENCFFDIKKGHFSSPIDTQSIDSQSSLLFHNFISSIKENYSPFTENINQRNELLNILISFFEEHITNHRHIKSQEVLRTIL